MSDINSLWMQYLQGEGYSLSDVNSMIMRALESETGDTGDINSLWMKYLSAQGYTDGDINSRMVKWLAAKGYDGDINAQLIKALLAGDIFAAAAISCVYPLDATAGEITGAGYSGKLTMSEGDQTGQYTIVGSLGATVQYAAGPAGFSTGTAPYYTFASGKHVFEFQIQQMDANGGGGSDYQLNFGIANKTLTKNYTVAINALAGGTYQIRGDNSFGGVVVATGFTPAPTTVAVVIDSDAGQVYIRYNGANYAVTADAGISTEELFVAIVVVETAGVTGATGNIIRGRVETQAANFVGSYETGSLDPCGNTI